MQGSWLDDVLAWDNDQALAVGHRDMFPLAKNPEPLSLESADQALVSNLRELCHKLTSTVRMGLIFFKSSRL